MRKKITTFLCLFFTFCITSIVIAQSNSSCPVVVGQDTLSCPNTPVCTPFSLNEVFKKTNTYAKSTIPHAPYPTTGFAQNLNFGGNSLDDRFAQTPTNIGFPFCFFGNTYNQCVVSTNGFITFDLTTAGTGSTPYNPVAIPNNAAPNNSVYGVYTDLQLFAATDIKYKTIGNYPCRKFVVAFVNVGFFGNLTNPNFRTTFQIVLYEGSNKIEIHVTRKVGSASTATGSVCGIENATGSGGVNGSQFATGWNNTNFTVNANAPQARLFAPNGTPFNNIFVYPINNGITSNVAIDTLVNGVDTSVCLPGPFPAKYVLKYQTCNLGYNATGTYSPKPYFIGDTITVNQDSLDILLAPIKNTCFNSCDGKINVTIQNDTVPPFYYCLTNYLTGDTLKLDSAFSTPFILDSLCVGKYQVCVTSAGGCFICDTISVTQPDSLIASIAGSQSVLCNPQATGLFIVNTVGGTPNYTYNSVPSYIPVLSNATSTASFLNVLANNYVITVTDINGCSDTAMIDITQPALPLSLATSQTNISCFGNSTGAITLTGSGGTVPYQYKIGTAGVYGNGNTFSSLIAGNYTVFIKDANGCTTSVNVVLTQPNAALTLGSTQVNIDCFGNSTGSITLIANGGTPTFTYTCSGAVNNTGIFNALIANTYSCSVQDNNGCVSAANIIITQPNAALNGTITSQTNVLCFGGNNASLVITGSGGTTNYTFDILAGPNSAIVPTVTGNTGTFSLLLAGSSNVVITDANGCTKTINATITEPNVLNLVQDSLIAVDCFGNSTGKICVKGVGAVAPYDFNCSGPNGYTNNVLNQNSNCFTGLPLGTYNVVITDANNCSTQQNYIVTQPQAPLSFVITSVDSVSCKNGADGSVNLVASGGTTPYEYNATPFVSYQNTLPLTGLDAGVHIIKVRDANGCLVVDTATIFEPAFVLDFVLDSATNVWCNSGNNGCIYTHAIFGTGTPTYTYDLSSAGAFTNISGIFCGLTANTYTVYLKDANNCIATVNALITEPPPLQVIITTDSVNCFGGSDGCATMTAVGGTLPYKYYWLNSPLQSTNLICGLNASNNNAYKVIDSLGCMYQGNFNILQPNKLIVTAVDTINLCAKDPILITSSATGGTPQYTYNWSPGVVSNNDSVVVTPPGAGVNIYTVYVTDAYGCSSNNDSALVIVRPTPVPIITIGDSVGCVTFCAQFYDNSYVSNTLGDFLVYRNWEFGDGFTSTNLQPNNCYTNAGDYTVCLTVESNRGCKKKICNVNLITVNPIPENDFSYDPEKTDLLKPMITFTNGKIDSATYFWNYGDGEKENSDNSQDFVFHQYRDTGTYTIQLVTQSDAGCLDTIEHVIIIEPTFAIYIPTAFTPNEDNHNNKFVVKGTSYKDVELQIFNRYGELIFKQYGLDPDNSWDGANAPQGVYSWQLFVTDPKGKRIRKEGSVTLIR